MLNKYSPKTDEKPTCTFPTTKLKNISCVFCRHQFYIRDLGYLKGKHLPLLLNCGHAVCQNCATNHTGDPCPLCKAIVDLNESKGEKLLPVNVYVIGLFGVAGTRPVHREEPDIAFTQSISTKIKQQTKQQGHCFQCGWQAVLKCLQCNELLCHACFSKIHDKLKSEGRNEGHFRVMLSDYSQDPIFATKKCHLHDAIFEYYCEDCESSGCPHCMLEFHKQHNTTRQSVKNEEYVEDFQKVQEKLAETRQRIHQAQKKLKKALLFPDELQNSETTEAAINQHFTHLHGVLQNVERRLIDQLYEHRNYTTRNLNDIQQQLKIQEEQVQTGLLMATAVNDLSGKVSLKDAITKLESLADVPCHLVENPIAVQEKIMFSCESSIIEMLENHCKLILPEVASYNLLTKDKLPEDYKLEPLDVEELTRNETFSLDKSLNRCSSRQSVASSCRSETPSLKQNGFNFVHVCYVDSPSNFYVRLACHRQVVGEMEVQLSEYSERSRPLDVVQQNKIYALRRHANRWCRGRVNAINTSQGSPDTYEVFHLDFGRTESRVPKSRLRSIPEEIAAMPQTAINCSLHDIVPKDGVWGTTARKFMTEFFKLKERSLTVFMSIVKMKENTYLVDICKEPTRDGEGRNISLRDSLIFEGYGTFVSSQHLLRTSPQSVRRFFREDFNLNTYYDVKCCHVDSPFCIFVQKAGDHLVFLDGLMNEMSAIYEKIAKTNKWTIHVPESGMPCAIEKAPSVWCRGLVTDVPAARTVEVFLIDFGSKIVTNYEKIRSLHEKFMIGPGQAIKVSLADIEPFNGIQWSEQAREFTKDYIAENFARLVAFEKSDFGYNVALYLNEVTNFAALLANSKYAVSTGPRSSGVVEVPVNQPNPKPQKPKVRNSRTCKQKNQKRERKIIDSAQNGFGAPSNAETTENLDPFRVEVKIIRVESPDVVYVADPGNEKKYHEMMDQMQKFYNKHKGISDKSEWKVDFPCVVYSTSDRLFCRGKIIAINSPDEAEVFLCDLAFTVKVPVNELQGLKKTFWRTQYYAFKVKLGGISPCGGSSMWPSASCNALKDIVCNNQRSRFFISKVINPDDNDLNVELYVEQAKIEGALEPAIFEISSINWMLVDLGLALPNKRYNEATKKQVLAIELMRQITTTEKVQRDESYKFIEYGKLEESDADSVFTDSNSSKNSTAQNERTVVSNEEIPTSWLPAEPILDNTFIAKPSFVDDYCCVYLYSVSQNGNMLRSIENHLESIYANTKPEPEDLVWKEGDLCIAQYHFNKKWYRAQVCEIMTEKEMIKVEFIDYGSLEECETGTLRKSLAMTHIPRQSTKCVIHGLYPNTPTHKWRTHDLDKIHSLIVDQDCEITVKKRKADHLEVEIAMLHPTRRDLVKHLVKDLRMDVLVDYSEADCSGSEPETTLDKSVSSTSDDVIIDGYFNSNGRIEEDRDFSNEEKKRNENSLDEKVMKNHEEDSVDEKNSIEKLNENSFEEQLLNNKTELSDDDKSLKNSEEDVVIEKIIKKDVNDDSNGNPIQLEKEDNEKATKDLKNDSFNIKNAVREFTENLNAKLLENSAKDDLNIKSIEEDEDLEVIRIYQGKSVNESQVYEADVENNNGDGSTIIAEHPTVVTASQLRKMNFSNHYDDFSTNNTVNVSYYDEDDIVLAGTLSLTRGAGEIELGKEEAMGKLETISLPDSCCMKEDELVASTPFNNSMECASSSIYKTIVFPPDVKVVKAEVAVVGPDVSWLHLLDHEKSKVVTQHRKKYERIVENMQKHAEKQPRLLKIYGKDTPCCAKYTDGLWYRCTIIDQDLSTQTFDDVVRVCFVDWGNFADVKFDEVRSMKEEWLEAPCLSLPCRLWGVEKAPGAVPEVFIKKLWEAYSGNVTLAKPVYVEIKNFHNQIYDVQIFTDEECTQLVYESLIKEGLFIRNTKQKSD